MGDEQRGLHSMVRVEWIHVDVEGVQIDFMYLRGCFGSYTLELGLYTMGEMPYAVA